MNIVYHSFLGRRNIYSIAFIIFSSVLYGTPEIGPNILSTGKMYNFGNSELFSSNSNEPHCTNLETL